MKWWLPNELANLILFHLHKWNDTDAIIFFVQFVIPSWKIMPGCHTDL
jgi:hypothetical protein